MPTHFRPTLIGMLVLIALSAIGTPASRANHPFHVCIGQMQWNPSNGRWEVSLRMHPRDLELELSDLNRKNISREDPQFPKFAVEYLANQFFLMRSQDSQDLKVIAERISQADPNRKLDQRSSLEWVGMENERGWLWIHLEMTPPEADPAPGPLYLVHRIFLDRIEAQENSVAILHTRSNRSSLQFKRGQIVKPFATPPAGGGLSARIDSVDKIDCVDGGLD
jgi:hypothetical protein